MVNESKRGREWRNGCTAFRPQIVYTEAIMKRLKRILAVLTLIVGALVISYLVYTGGQMHA